MRSLLRQTLDRVALPGRVAWSQWGSPARAVATPREAVVSSLWIGGLERAG
jgi:hypothetical protein